MVEVSGAPSSKDPMNLKKERRRCWKHIVEENDRFVQRLCHSQKDKKHKVDNNFILMYVQMFESILSKLDLDTAGTCAWVGRLPAA